MTDLFDLTGRVAIVTGASRGLGKEMAWALADAGADLSIGARNAADLESTAAELAAATGRQVAPVVLDVTDRASVESCVAQTLERFGRLDILVNNAGINVRSPLAEIRDEDFRRIQDVNVTGAFLAARAVVAPMTAGGFGRIINIGSALSLVGLSHRVSYTTSKGALLQMTRTLAVELAPTGITANILCPGPFATEMNRPLLSNPAAAAEVIDRVPMRRWGQLHEIRGPVVFLASPSSAYVTGAVLSVDGGWAAG